MVMAMMMMAMAMAAMMMKFADGDCGGVGGATSAAAITDVCYLN